jgi:hypothetical protein
MPVGIYGSNWLWIREPNRGHISHPEIAPMPCVPYNEVRVGP